MANHDGITTKYEWFMIQCLYLTVITIIILLVMIIQALTDGGISGIIAMFTDKYIAIMLLCWICCLTGLFLRGYLYIQRMNEAIYQGQRSKDMPLHGIIIKTIYTLPKWCTKKYYKRLLVQLDDGRIIKSPSYFCFPYDCHECDVYFYKGRYYFTNFRRHDECRRWWNQDSSI